MLSSSCNWSVCLSLMVTTHTEGNPTYLPNAPHLFNLEKKRLTCRVLLQLRRIQRVQYSLQPLPLAQLVISRAFATGRHLSAAQASEWSRRMFHISLQLEGKDGTSTHVHKSSAAMSSNIPKAASVANISLQDIAPSIAPPTPPLRGSLSSTAEHQAGSRMPPVPEDSATSPDSSNASEKDRPPLPKKKFFSFRRDKASGGRPGASPAVTTPLQDSGGRSSRQMLLGSKSEYHNKSENRKSNL